MHPDQLPALVLLAPTLFILGTVYLLGPILPITKTWARALIVASVWLIVARYEYWRLTETVLTAAGAWYEMAWVWFCYLVETLALFDGFILYLILLRTSDRSGEADRHETRLRALPAPELPSVDVFIPTYNEPIEVLEKTIVGAQCIDYPNFSIWILDDGRRPWLKDFCEARGVGYITRPDNRHAKAGNVNHALGLTNGAFVAVFDADFIPQRQFLMRTIGFFDDPRIGIVQLPHSFYNYDPMQVNLDLRGSLPDDQRFFFEAIMPSRDAWDAAFCCGSNSVTRRAAFESVGGGLPTSSITEDMLLTLVMLRKGYITRYLCESLAYGLAPEGLSAFFIQRLRWARGATQILFLKEGPLGANLSLVNRLMFLPSHWLTQSASLLLTIIAPLVFIWTGLKPLVNVDTESIVMFVVPMVLAMIGGLGVLAPGKYLAFPAQIHGTFQSFKVLPVVLSTMARPFGHIFKVTPKGGAAHQYGAEPLVFWTAAGLLTATLIGLVANMIPEFRIVSQISLLPVVAFWSILNIVVLFFVCMVSLQSPVSRSEERFKLEEPLTIFDAHGRSVAATLKDISLSGAALTVERNLVRDIAMGDRVNVFISSVGFVRSKVVRRLDEVVAVKFELGDSLERELLIGKLFTQGRNSHAIKATTLSATASLFGSILFGRLELPKQPAAETHDVAAKDTAPRLAKASTLVPPVPQPQSLVAIAEQRKSLAA